ESEYRAALEVDPNDVQAQCRMGDIAAKKNDLNEAYARYTKAVELQPSNPDANIGLAKVLMSMGQPEKAQPILEHALELDPTSAVAHFRLSTVYRELGRPDDAKRELAEYQKYKEMKQKLQNVFHDLRPEEGMGSGDSEPSR
ncbi:MAG: tetratricopeptide repeat protein, partial [Candidatus Acidiferrales bacterium]